MKKALTILTGAALALTGATGVNAETRAEKSEAQLARMLEGRTAGEPVQCISAYNGNRIRVMDHVGIVYDAGDTIYVARAVDPKMLDHWDIPVIERFGSQLCANDVMRTVDRTAGHMTGPLFLHDFVPYTKNG